MKKVNDIVRVGNMLTRIHQIDGDRVTIYDGELREIDIRDILPALPKDTLIYFGGTQVKVPCEMPIVTDETIIDGYNFVNEVRSHNARVIFPDNDTEGNAIGFEKEIIKYLAEDCGLPYSVLAIKKIAAEYSKNNQKLKEILSNSPYWDEENLSLSWYIDIPQFGEKEKAKCVYYNILDAYCAEYRNDFYRIPSQLVVNFVIFNEIDDEKSKRFKSYGLHIQSGMKPTRAIRKYFEELGISRVSNFEKMYAELADAMSEKTIKRRITLSIHPLDFLRMSEGNSWTSCHNVRKGGCYCNGTLSYLMDGASMVCSLLDPKSEEKPYLQDKINRMMFFLNDNGDILQSRLYPQTRIPELEDILAHEVAEKISECMQINNKYKAVVNDVHCGNYVLSKGVHYRDYECNNFGQRIWSCKDTPNDFTIGHESYCIKCGETNNRTGYVLCGRCEQEGGNTRIYTQYICPTTHTVLRRKEDGYYNPEDGRYYSIRHTCKECGEYFFDNHVYCKDCRKTHPITCKECGEIIEDIAYYIEGDFYCDECYDENFITCADCGEVIKRDEAIFISDTEEMICEDCCDRGNYWHCEDCGRYYSSGEDCTYIENHGDVCNSCYDTGDYTYCDICNYYYRSDETTRVGDDIVCDDCLNESYTQCDYCGEYEHNDYVERLANGDCYCERCANEHCVQCEECGDMIDYDDAISIGNGYYCQDCADEVSEVCTKCRERVFNDDVYTHNDEAYCEDCYEELMAIRAKEALETSNTLDKTGTINSPNYELPLGQEVEILKETEDKYIVVARIYGREYYRYVNKCDVDIEENEEVVV